MTDRKKPGVAFWATVVVVVVLVGYPLSTGPADWMVMHGWLSQDSVEVLARFYSPLRWQYRNSPEPIRRAIDWYEHLWRR